MLTTRSLSASLACLACLAALAGTAAASEPTKLAVLSADQIIDRNIAARGGLDAWRKVESMAWLGHIEDPSAPSPRLPFVLQLKRPDKTRFEITALGQQSVRAYDGSAGWKLTPGSGGKPSVQPYSPEELRFAREGQEGQAMTGPLVDYRAKGIAVAVDGEDMVDGRPAYRLRVTLPSGTAHHLWIDGQTFLDVKYDRASESRSGRSVAVSVYNRDFRAVDGLQVPMRIESGFDGGTMEKMVIDRVMVNPLLPDRVFARPVLSGWGGPSAAGALNRRPSLRTGSQGGL